MSKKKGMDKERQYRNISLHENFAENIEKIIDDSAINYKTLSEFVHDACRRRLEQLLAIYPHLKDKFDTTELENNSF